MVLKTVAECIRSNAKLKNNTQKYSYPPYNIRLC